MVPKLADIMSKNGEEKKTHVTKDRIFTKVLDNFVNIELALSSMIDVNVCVLSFQTRKRR